VVLIREKVNDTNWKMNLECTTCNTRFSLADCHHVTCKECRTAYCPHFAHTCEEKCEQAK
jgi:hypothetical protein